MRHGRRRVGRGALVLTTAMVAGLIGSAPAVVLASDQSAPPARFKKATFGPQGVGIKRMTTAVQMTKEEQAPSRAFTGPTSMLADPGNPKVIVAAVADLRTRVCQLLRSTDAGRTWRFSKALPAPPSYPSCTSNSTGNAEASIAWGRGGTLYYASQAYGQGEGVREGKVSIMVARSTDLGDSWKSTLVEDNRGKTGVAPTDSGVTGLAVDTSGARDVIYVGFSRSYPTAPDGSPLKDPIVLISTSSDGGATFSKPVNINDSAKVTQTIGGKSYSLLMRTSFGAPFITARNGVLLVVAGSVTPSNDLPPSPTPSGTGLSPGSFYAVPLPQLIARSTDQGRTWSVATLGPPIYAGTGNQTGLGWTAKGGANGTFVAAYAATPETSTTTGVADLVVQRSTDGGQTWSDPVAVNDDSPDQQFTNFYPQVGVAPDGRVDVVWQDNRNQSDYRFNVRYTYSTDGGATWAPNVQINDQPVDFNLGTAFNYDLRQPPGVASTDAYAAIGWTDSRLATSLTQTQDDYSAAVQFAPLPSRTNKILSYVAAVFAGLVVAGIILLVVLAGRRRGQGPEPSGERRPEPVGVG